MAFNAPSSSPCLLSGVLLPLMATICHGTSDNTTIGTCKGSAPAITVTAQEKCRQPHQRAPTTTASQRRRTYQARRTAHHDEVVVRGSGHG